MYKVTPCLWFKDNAEEAARFYTSILPGSGITHIQKSVIDNPGGPAGAVLIVDFQIAGQRFMALNGGMTQEHNFAVSFMIECDDQAEVDSLWDAFGNGGQPLECGWIKDRFGVHWQVVPRVMLEMLADKDTAKAARAMQAMMGMVKLDIAALKKAFEG